MLVLLAIVLIVLLVLLVYIILDLYVKKHGDIYYKNKWFDVVITDDDDDKI